jgi:hypothetical protein
MRLFLSTVFLSLLLVNPAFAAFTSNVVVLEKQDIGKLSDEKLLDAYTDVLVELEAVKTFHTTSGFTTKQYDEYRSLLKYRLQLLLEIHSRNLEIPQQMERL